MVTRRRRRFERPLGERRYRRMFIIAVEGEKTEPQYFEVLNGASPIVHVRCLPGGSASAPERVLKRMREHLRTEKLLARDEAWLVVDRDRWTDEHLDQLVDWCREDTRRRGFALSNPAFELWLLLHFEDAKGVTTKDQCVWRLRQHIPTYDKNIATGKFTLERITTAVKRASRRDHPACADWPRSPGVTTVYRLVKRILAADP